MEKENVEEKIRQAVLAIRKSRTNPAGRHWLGVAEGFLAQALALSSPHPEAREEDIEIGTPREFAERLAWMTVNGKPDLDQWENHIKFRDAALSRLAAQKDEGQDAREKEYQRLVDGGPCGLMERPDVEPNGCRVVFDAEKCKGCEFYPALSSPHPEAREEDIATIRDALNLMKGYTDDADEIANSALAALSRLAAQKDEGRTISWQLINDIIDETLEEEAAPLECALQMILSAHGYTAVNEPAIREPDGRKGE